MGRRPPRQEATQSYQGQTLGWIWITKWSSTRLIVWRLTRRRIWRGKCHLERLRWGWRLARRFWWGWQNEKKGDLERKENPYLRRWRTRLRLKCIRDASQVKSWVALPFNWLPFERKKRARWSSRPERLVSLIRKWRVKPRSLSNGQKNWYFKTQKWQTPHDSIHGGRQLVRES